MSESALAPTTSIAPARVTIWTSIVAMMRWSLASIGAMLPLIVVIQAVLAAGLVIGFGFLIPDITSETALFLSSGVPTVLLLVIGLVIVPQGVSRARMSGALDYQRALPVARPVLLIVDLAVWALIALPGVAVGLFVAWLRYDLTFAFDVILLVVASLLVTTMATAVGYAIAVSLPPTLAQLVTQVLVFFVMLFSPITFPARQLPAWFQSLHDVLPIQAAGDLMRAGIASDDYAFSGWDLVTLTLWTAVGLLITVRALMRRR
ncbi:multidrug ABC transporter permease [Microbacterium faecale]|uniref:Multidrug ABC transporter permease n=1 Tax=Microbacterium faecale TaxID=1804630 RepID=A0A917DJN8_9MICO|nr:ABC transporter permease [Microbacterium faecale]GGD42409.1 multidrug ABC transporter permease [Microbacterium faecale]